MTKGEVMQFVMAESVKTENARKRAAAAAAAEADTSAEPQKSSAAGAANEAPEPRRSDSANTYGVQELRSHSDASASLERYRQSLVMGVSPVFLEAARKMAVANMPPTPSAETPHDDETENGPDKDKAQEEAVLEINQQQKNEGDVEMEAMKAAETVVEEEGSEEE